MEWVKEKEVKGLLERNIYAAKGDSGRVLVIGSERYPGAAGLAGLAALRAGADSVMVAAPESTARIVSGYSPDLMVTELSGALSEKHAKELALIANKASCVLIGPGLGLEKSKLLGKLFASLRTRVVLDADATKQADFKAVSKAIILANKPEYELVKKQEMGSNVLVIKGKEDQIKREEKSVYTYGGSSRAAVSGTGDVLAGITVAIYAQLEDPFKAAKAACVIGKTAATIAFAKHHYGFLASDLLLAIPQAMKDLRIFRVTKHDPKPKR